jgi:plasmid maintenance system antidote protein VapI
LPVFGQRSHVTEAINGKRPISATQARKLGEMFSVQPGLFL